MESPGGVLRGSCWEELPDWSSAVDLILFWNAVHFLRGLSIFGHGTEEKSSEKTRNGYNIFSSSVRRSLHPPLPPPSLKGKREPLIFKPFKLILSLIILLQPLDLLLSWQRRQKSDLDLASRVALLPSLSVFLEFRWLHQWSHLWNQDFIKFVDFKKVQTFLFFSDVGSNLWNVFDHSSSCKTINLVLIRL